ncbi:MAG: NAD(P)-dependent oxidoreductase, partial [Mesorhizobium sp.]
MRHVIFGGDGFVGRHLASKILADGEEVVVADIARSDLPHYRFARYVRCDVTDAASVAA